MEANVQKLLEEYHVRAKAEFAAMEKLSREDVDRRIDEFLIPVGPDTGALLHSLTRSLDAKRVVEIGASYGYSAIWLADAVRQTGEEETALRISDDCLLRDATCAEARWRWCASAAQQDLRVGHGPAGRHLNHLTGDEAGANHRLRARARRWRLLHDLRARPRAGGERQHSKQDGDMKLRTSTRHMYSPGSYLAVPSSYLLMNSQSCRPARLWISAVCR